MSIVAAIRDRSLLGAHPDYAAGLASFRAWLGIYKAVFGEKLDAFETELFERFSGRRYSPPKGGWSTCAVLSPRRCGKSLFAATLAAYAAVIPGPRNTWVALVGQDRAGAQKSLLAQVGAFFEAEYGGALHETVTGRTADTIALNTGCSIGVWPSRPASLRGASCRLAVLDEADFSSTEGASEDKTRQMVAAAKPALATNPGSKLVLISSPGRVGSFFHGLITEGYGKDDPDTLVLKLDASVNPALLESDYFRSMQSLDPAAYRAECLGEYVESEGGLYDHAALTACVVSGRGDIPPEAVASERLVCAVDPSSGARNGDSFAACLGYRDKGGRVVVVASRRWAAPFDPRAVVGEVESLCKAYGVRRCVGDRFGSNLIASLFREAGLEYQPAETNTSDALLELGPAFSTGAIELPDPSVSTVASDLRDDLRAIVRRAGGGRDRADAPRNSRGHCDLAAALSVLFAALPKQKPKPRMVAPVIVGPKRNGWAVYSGQKTQDIGLLDAA